MPLSLIDRNWINRYHSMSQLLMHIVLYVAAKLYSIS